MNDTLLRQLYDGKVYPAEDMGRFPPPQERRRSHSIEQEAEYLKNSLSPEDWERFMKLDSLQKDSASEYAFENFAFGFRLGAMLMVEVIAGGQEIIHE